MVALPTLSSAAGSPQCPSVAAPPTSVPALSDTPLGTIAAGKKIGLGVQLDAPPSGVYGDGVYDPVYQQIIVRERPYFGALGSAFKFGNVCPDPPVGGELVFTHKAAGVSNTWQLAQDLTGGLQSQGIHGRADALVWNVVAEAPAWLKTLPSSGVASAEYKTNLNFLQKYISAALKAMTQMQNKDPYFFFAAGLINEPIIPNFASPSSPAPATYRGGPFLPAGYQVASFSGVPDYIRNAFSYAEYYRTYWAKQLGLPATAAQWYLNETLCETDQYGPTMRPALLTLLKAMLAAKLGITAVGLECHLQPQMMKDAYHPDWTAFGAFIQAIGDLGLDVYITELDVLDYETSCSGSVGTPSASESLIDVYYDTFLRKVLSYKNVKVVTLWDLSDRYTFYRYMDEATWYDYDRIARPKPANTPWPNCPTLPAKSTSIACPRPNVFDDAMKPKPARAKIAAALSAAPSR